MRWFAVLAALVVASEVSACDRPGFFGRRAEKAVVRAVVPAEAAVRVAVGVPAVAATTTTVTTTRVVRASAAAVVSVRPAVVVGVSDGPLWKRWALFR